MSPSVNEAGAARGRGESGRRVALDGPASAAQRYSTSMHITMAAVRLAHLTQRDQGRVRTPEVNLAANVSDWGVSEAPGLARDGE